MLLLGQKFAIYVVIQAVNVWIYRYVINDFNFILCEYLKLLPTLFAL